MKIMYFICFRLILVLTCIFTTASTATVKESQELLKNALNQDGSVDAANQLIQAGVIKDDKTEVNKLKTKKTDLIKAFQTGKFDERDGANVANALATGVKNGLPDLVRGFKTKNWYYLTVGTLNLLTALSVVVGGPYGAIVGALLSVITSILKVFGEPASESQEQMISRLLKDFEVTNLYTDVVGVKMFYETLQSSVKNFRENPSDLTMAEATSLYALSFDNINIFGKLQEKIEEFCHTGPVTDANRAEKDLNVKRCFKMIKGYMKLTAIRQMLLAEMAGICQEAVTMSAKHKDGFNKTSINFVHLIKEAQALDGEVLSFLTTPMESVDSRYTIFELLYSPSDNKEIISYLKRLDIIQSVDPKDVDKLFNRDNIMICSKEKLQGLCQLVKKGFRSGEIAKIDNWSKTKSMFIPPGLDVKGKIGATMVGPFTGLAVYSSPDKLDALDKVQVIVANKEANNVRICTDKKWCDDVEQIDNFQSLGKDAFHGISISKIQSIWVPTGFVAMLTNPTIMAGPLIGELDIRDVSKKEWKEILIKKSPEISAADVVTVCEKPKYEGYCQQLGDEFYKDAPVKFAGMKSKISKYMPSADQTEREIYSVDNVLSMKIPAGFEVNLYSSKIERGKVIKSGPYVGPLELSELEDDSIDMATVKKMVVKPAATTSKRHKVHHKQHRQI